MRPLHLVSLHRDAGASAIARTSWMTTPGHSAGRRRSLGRLGDAAPYRTVAAASRAEDRILQHSITYALIELADFGRHSLATRAY